MNEVSLLGYPNYKEWDINHHYTPQTYELIKASTDSSTQNDSLVKCLCSPLPGHGRGFMRELTINAIVLVKLYRQKLNIKCAERVNLFALARSYSS